MRGACPLSTLPVMGYLSFRKSISAVEVLSQADKAYCSLTKKAAFGAQHNRQRVHSVCIEPGGGYAMTAFLLWGKAERELPRRKTSLAACRRRHTNGYNDTRALDALKASCAAPISMGRGETPVRLQLTTARFCLISHIVQAGAHILYYAANREGKKMIDKLQLQQMRNVDITQVDRSTLIDIRNIHIDSSLPAAKKMQSYLEQIVNPYCFLCGDTPVRIRFVAEDRTLKQSLCDYFLSLK